jgi:hypothetical protein
MMRPEIGLELVRLRVEDLLRRSTRGGPERSTTRRPLPRRER